jgi:hypothetical protein
LRDQAIALLARIRGDRIFKAADSPRDHYLAISITSGLIPCACCKELFPNLLGFRHSRMLLSGIQVLCYNTQQKHLADPRHIARMPEILEVVAIVSQGDHQSRIRSRMVFLSTRTGTRLFAFFRFQL